MKRFLIFSLNLILLIGLGTISSFAKVTVKSGNGWTVTFNHPENYRKGVEYDITLDIEGPGVMATNTCEVTVVLYEKDIRFHDKIKDNGQKEKKFTVSCPADGGSKKIIKTLIWKNVILSEYELFFSIELFAEIKVKKISGHAPGFIIRGFSNKNSPVKIPKVR